MIVTSSKPIWSKSRARTFQDCRRKFYLTYPSLEVGTKEATRSLFERARKLKTLKTRQLWTASLIHEMMGDRLKLLRQGVALPDESTTLTQFQQRMQEEFLASQENQIETGRLYEHEHGIKIAPEVWQRSREQVERAIQWFYHSAWLTRLKSCEPHQWKVVDELLDFDVDGSKVFVKIDCALEINNRFVLIDWKTAAPREEDEKNMMLAALYAQEVWDAPLEQLDGYVVSVLDGQKRSVRFSPEGLESIKSSMAAQVLSMKEFSAKNEVEFDELPYPPSLKSCFSCSYQKICHPQGVGF